MHVAAASSSARLERQLAFALAASLLVSFLAVVLVLVIRRLSGALVQPLSGSALLGSAVVCAIVAALLRLACPGLPRTALSTQYSVPGTWYPVLSTPHGLPLTNASTPDTTINGLFFALPGIASLLLLAALTLPGTSIGGVLVAWLLWIASETASWLVFYRQTSGPRNAQPGRALPPVVAPALTNEESEEEVPAGLVQQITRVRQDDGESIHVMVTAEIPAGDNLAVVHLAFCPPLEHAPALTAHAVEAEDAAVKITQAETFGARIEVRFPRAAAEPRSVVVEILGSAKGRQQP